MSTNQMPTPLPRSAHSPLPMTDVQALAREEVAHLCQMPESDMDRGQWCRLHVAQSVLSLAARVGELEAALADAVRTWTFNDYQHPTHSWHDREDWYERHEVAREVRRAALAAPRETGKE